MPGDAFRRAKARVKTSILILRLKEDGEEQSDIFMVSSVFLGIEEKTAQRIGLGSTKLDKEKDKEIRRIVSDFLDFSSGKNGSYVVPVSNAQDRLDVKYCINDRGRRKQIWIANGHNAKKVGDVLTPVTNRTVKVTDSDEYQFLRVNYGGEVIEGDLIDGMDCSYSQLYQVRSWDILMSNMGIGRGAIGIVPTYHDGKYVSNEYTIVRATTKEEAIYYTNLLRTKEILGDILSTTTGMNRGRIKWENIKLVDVPEYVTDENIEKLVNGLESIWNARINFESLKLSVSEKIGDELQTNTDEAELRWLSFKPPE